MSDNKKSSKSRKTIMKCFKCKIIREEKDTVLCSLCNKRYDFDCFGLSEKLYEIMKPENKLKLKCNLCTQNSKLVKPDKSASRGSNTEVSNVTKRKKYHPESEQPKTSKAPENTTISRDKQETIMCDSYDLYDEGTPDKSEIERLSRSEDYTTSDLYDVNELNDQVADLKIKLMTTENELENTIIENNDLKRQIIKLSTEIKLLKEVCQASTAANIIAPHCATLSNTPLRNRQNRRSTRYSPGSATSTTSDVKDEITSAMQRKICDLKEQLRAAEEQIKALHSQIKVLEEKLLDAKDNNFEKSNLDRVSETTQNNVDNRKTIQNTTSSKGNIAIISTFQSDKLLKPIAKQFGDDFNYCHYCKPGAGIMELFSNIEEKLKNFTTTDCCIVCIGESDFQKSKDSKALVYYISDSIKKIGLLTNIIICAPSYICGSALYNCRVENFNNMLFLDMQAHGLGTLYDTNLNLSLEMFSYKTGKLNSYGLNNVLNDLKKITTYLLEFTSHSPLNDQNTAENNRLHVKEKKTTLLDYFLPVGKSGKIDSPKKFFR